MKMEKVLRSALLLLLAAALCLSMAACTQTPAESSPVSETQTPETAASEKASPEDDMPEDAGTEETPASDALSSALPVKTLRAKRVDENPYMAKSDANIHHDGYNTDSTDEVLPLGIYPEINVSYEKTNANASPAIYFDSYGHAVVPLLGGIAIRDLNAKETTTLGYFSPKQHDGGGYVIQSSYTFLDSENRIVCPTSNNHVLMLRATDEAGNILPEFEKVLDINIKAAAEAALGKTLEQNLLSVVFDYEGNLWFATGGFRIYPERQQQGVLGYIARSAIDAILSGEQTDLSDAVFVYELTPGEGAENGIAASKDGAVILTNQNCYLLRANNGVEAVWCTPYESVGAQVQGDGPSLTLKKRLDKALEFLQAHPDRTVIVSGGQGPDEAHTEASVMAQYLLAHGADASQILEEPQASNTRENLLFSAKLAEEAGFDTSRVLIVTSDFHMCRAKYIARTLGMEPYGLSSGTWPWILKLNYTLREVFAFCKAVYQAHR